MPVVLTGDPDLARQRTVETFGYYASVPSYRAMLDREGAQGIEDIAILGDEAEVRAGLRRLEEAGVTDLCLFPYDAEPGSGARTLALLGDLAVGGRISSTEHADRCGISTRTALRDLVELVELGYLAREGEKRGTRFRRLEGPRGAILGQ